MALRAWQCLVFTHSLCIVSQGDLTGCFHGLTRHTIQAITPSGIMSLEMQKMREYSEPLFTTIVCIIII